MQPSIPSLVTHAASVSCKCDGCERKRRENRVSKRSDKPQEKSNLHSFAAVNYFIKICSSHCYEQEIKDS